MRALHLMPLAALPLVVVVACSDSDDPGGSPAGGADASAGTPNVPPGSPEGGASNVCGEQPPKECATPTCIGGVPGSSPKPAGAACSDGVCDGAGGCAVKLGTACTDPAKCASGFCVDGVCCNEACTGECKSCSLEGKKGFCSNLAYYQEDDSFVAEGTTTPRTCDTAIAGSRCDGNGKCLRTVGVACEDGTTCMSGECVSSKCLGAPGELCDALGDCASNVCAVGVCE